MKSLETVSNSSWAVEPLRHWRFCLALWSNLFGLTTCAIALALLTLSLPTQTSLQAQSIQDSTQTYGSLNLRSGNSTRVRSPYLKQAGHQELVIPSVLEIESGSSSENTQGSETTFEELPAGVVHGQAHSGLGLPSRVLCDDACAGDVSDNAFDYLSGSRRGTNYYLLDWSRAELWVGTVGFTNPSGVFRQGATTAQVEGAFGFQQGFNFGSQLPSLLAGQVGSQIGMRFIQSNLEGTQVADASRNQMFVTAGLFRRVDYGIQGGVVLDYFRQQWVEQADLYQVRGELSYLFSPAHEIGFRFTENGRTDQQTVRLLNPAVTLSTRLRALDTYRVFGRVRFGHCAASAAEAHVGTSNDGGVVLGCQLQQPLTGQLGLATSATYFVPGGNSLAAEQQEAWNLGLALVWTPGRGFGTERDYNRPLFDVADNGSFLTVRP